MVGLMQTARDATREAVERWRAQPAQCIEDLFGVQPDKWQIEALNGFRDGDRVTIRACHGPGKSALAAWLVHWFMLTRFPTRIPCTAPTGHQLEDILWAELAKWNRQLPPSLRELFAHTSDRYSWAPAPKESFAVARTSRPEQPEGLQGFHCQNLLFILDEASGIPDEVYEVAQGALSEDGAKVLLTGNPTRSRGYFYDSHHRMRHLWHTMKVGHMDSPRVSDAYVDEMATKYGEDSNVFRVRVLGEFPLEDDDSVISLELAEAAVSRDIGEDMGASTVWGVDVARFGDDATALVKRRGPVVHEAKSWRGKDLMQTAGLIFDEYKAAPPARRPERVCVDSIGLGSGVVDRLKELGVPVRGVNVAEAPSVKQRYMRLRDELWWETREWFESRAVKLPEDAESLIGELTGPKYKMTSTGKLQVESKDDMKRRGLNSPDLADAMCLTFMRGAAKKRKHDIDYSRMHRGVV